MLTTEQIIFISRKLKWSLELIGKLHPIQAIELYNELVYQESLENYNRQYNIALLASMLETLISCNSKHPKHFKVTDFLQGEKPYRMNGNPKGAIEELAEQVNIKLPKN